MRAWEYNPCRRSTSIALLTGPYHRMMKLLTAALALVSLPFLAHGGEALYYAAINRAPVLVSCDQFGRQRPRALWLRVTGCNIDYLAVGYRESGSHIVELFFPIRPPGEPATAPVRLVVATSDPDALSAATQIIGDNRQPDQELFLVTMLRIVDLLRASREVEGYLRSGLMERMETRRALSGLTSPLAPDVAVLDLRARPGLVRPAIEFGMGVLLLLVAIAWQRRRPAPVAIEEPDSFAAEAQAPPAAPVLDRRLPPVMLLNLDASAGTTEVEFAPPLGQRGEVRERIAQVLGPLDGAANGREKVRGPDWYLALDLGRDEPVWAVTAEARGGDGSINALERLAHQTGWRIYVPRLGTFVEPEALVTLGRP